MTTPHAAAGAWPGWSQALQLTGIRLVALLADQEYGLLVYAPVYVLAIAGLPLLVKRAAHVAGPVALVAGSYLALVLLPLTNVHGWSGQWCPAGRFLTPVLPLLGAAVFVALRTWPRSTSILVAAQIALSAYFWQHPRLLWNDGDGRAAFCARTGEQVCATLPSLAPSVR